MLEAGMKAPEFALPDQNGKVHTLEEYKGKHVVSENYILNFQKKERLCLE